MAKNSARPWTNPSVRLLDAADPVSEIRARARRVILEALDQGWAGPPFDPAELARLRGIEIVARDGVRDARLVPAPKARLRLEFNPSRPPARVRYSIAHEIAHTLFPDCADEVRHRHEAGATGASDWELEALCNVAAAEFLMPAATFPQVTPEEVTIDKANELRERYLVSMEAVLIRLVQAVDFSCAMFAAARIEKGPTAGRIRLDYTIGSRVWHHRVFRGTLIDAGTGISHCSAIGFTSKSTERWDPNGDAMRVEAMGIPSYPGSVHPRIVGILVPTEAEHGARITYLRGDATRPSAKEPAAIVHVVNDSTPNWGGRGFATALKSRYPSAQTQFQRWAHGASRRLQLGEVHVGRIENGPWVLSLIAQHGYGSSPSEPRIRYRALSKCLAEVGRWAAEKKVALHMPRIGCGQAGGRWEVVQQLVAEQVCGRGVNAIVYDPPGRKESLAQELPQTLLDFS